MTTIGAPPPSQRRLHLHDPAPRPTRGGVARFLTVPGQNTFAFTGLVIVVGLLNVIGLAMVLSASSVMSLDTTGSAWTFFVKQAGWTVVGAACAFAALRLRLDTLRNVAVPAVGLCAVGLLAVHVPGIGVTANGATRWIGAGPIQIQPSELTKLAVILFIGYWLARNASHIDDGRVSIRPVMLVVAFFGVLLLAQRDLGSLTIVAIVALVVLFAAGVPRLRLSFYGLLGLGAFLVASFGSGYRRARISSFLDPWADPQHAGYQLIQSRVGLAAGGVFGVGIGSSRAKWGFLPFAHTDFIFAIVGEEMGLFGALVVVLSFLAIGVFGLQVAARAGSTFASCIAVGVTAWIVLQAFVNIGAVIGLLPITGVPLPFMSYGGTSMVVSLAAVGLLLNVARHPAPEPRVGRR